MYFYKRISFKACWRLCSILLGYRLCCRNTSYLFYLYEIIFKGEDIARSERERQVEVATRQCLSKTDYRQVYFLYESCDKMDMIMQILQKEGCKFYAKLTENNNIHLVVKDKHNEEVYSIEIENLIYFNSNFKFDE